MVRLAREGTLSPESYQACLKRVDQDIEHLALRDLTLDLCVSSGMPITSTPRSLDLVHLRTAVWFHSERKLDRFLTVDQDQAQAAKEMGLPVD